MKPVSFKVLTSHCDRCTCTQIAKKVGKVIIEGVPHEVLGAVYIESGKDIKILEGEGKVILYGGSSSLLMPCTQLGGRHVIRVLRKKCGTVTVSRHNSDAITSSPNRYIMSSP